MHTIKIDNKEIKISNESYKELKKHFTKEEKRWVPEEGEGYYFVYSDGEVDYSTWDNDTYDKFRLNTGNCFKTREEAEKHQDKLKAIADVTEYMYENDMVLELDWKDVSEEKYYICYNFTYCKFTVCVCFGSKYSINLPYINSKENGEKLIKEKEEQLRLVFEV